MGLTMGRMKKRTGTGGIPIYWSRALLDGSSKIREGAAPPSVLSLPGRHSSGLFWAVAEPARAHFSRQMSARAYLADVPQRIAAILTQR